MTAHLITRVLLGSARHSKEVQATAGKRAANSAARYATSCLNSCNPSAFRTRQRRQDDNSEEVGLGGRHSHNTDPGTHILIGILQWQCEVAGIQHQERDR